MRESERGASGFVARIGELFVFGANAHPYDDKTVVKVGTRALLLGCGRCGAWAAFWHGQNSGAAMASRVHRADPEDDVVLGDGELEA